MSRYGVSVSPSLCKQSRSGKSRYFPVGNGKIMKPIPSFLQKPDFLAGPGVLSGSVHFLMEPQSVLCLDICANKAGLMSQVFTFSA